jgi:hypothetical protein
MLEGSFVYPRYLMMSIPLGSIKLVSVFSGRGAKFSKASWTVSDLLDHRITLCLKSALSAQTVQVKPRTINTNVCPKIACKTFARLQKVLRGAPLLFLLMILSIFSGAFEMALLSCERWFLGILRVVCLPKLIQPVHGYHWTSISGTENIIWIATTNSILNFLGKTLKFINLW